MVASSGMTCLPQLPCSKQGRREARRRLVSSSAKQQYKWLDSARSITAFFALSRFRRWLRHRIAFDCFGPVWRPSPIPQISYIYCEVGFSWSPGANLPDFRPRNEPPDHPPLYNSRCAV